MKIFGVKYSKSSYIFTWIFGILALALLVLFVVTGYFVPNEADEVFVPDANLTESIFDAQNMVYQETAGLTEKYLFEDLAFSVDVPTGIRALVDDAMVINNGNYYFYYEAVDGNAVDAIRKAYTKIISMDAAADGSVVTVLNAQEGYINGCEAVFYVLSIAVEGSPVHYICAYDLKITESIMPVDKRIVLASMSADFSTTGLKNLQAFSEATVKTLSLDRKQAEKMGLLQR